MPPPLPPLPPPPLSPVVGRMWAQVTEYVGASDRKRVGASDRERVGASDGAIARVFGWCGVLLVKNKVMLCPLVVLALTERKMQRCPRRATEH